MRPWPTLQTYCADAIPLNYIENSPQNIRAYMRIFFTVLFLRGHMLAALSHLSCRAAAASCGNAQQLQKLRRLWTVVWNGRRSGPTADW